MTDSPKPARTRAGGAIVLVLLAVAVAGAIALKAREILDEPPLTPADAVDAQLLDAPAPAIGLLDRDGKRVSLAERRGRWVLLNFWATWCEPCREEMPAMVRLAKALAGDGLEIVAASVDESWAPIDGFFGESRPPFTVLRDPESKAAEELGTHKFPETYLIGPDGRLRARLIGPREWDRPEMVRFLEQTIGKPNGSQR